MKKVKLFVVKNEMQSGKINTLIFNQGTTIQDALNEYPILRDRKILSAELEDCEVIHYGTSGKKFQVSYTDLLLNEEGKIIGETNYPNPSYDELMTITPKEQAEMEGDVIMVDFYESLEECVA